MNVPNRTPLPTATFLDENDDNFPLSSTVNQSMIAKDDEFTNRNILKESLISSLGSP
jgi:hypothetical protein